MSDQVTGASAPESADVPAAAEELAPEVDGVEAEEGAEGASPAEQKKEAKQLEKEIKKWKLKIDGEELELGEDELVKHAQLGKAAQKRMQEVAQERKQFRAFIEQLQKDPVSVLQNPHLGVDVKKMAEAIINGEIEDMKKTPEQREKEKLQKELETLKKQHEDEKKSRERAEFERLQEQAAKQLDNDIDTAIKESGLPKSPYTVKKMAEMMMLALENGIDLGAKDLIPLLKKQVHGEIREMFSAAPEDVLEEMLGKDNISRLRKRQLQRIKQPTPSASDVKASGEDIKKKQAEEPKKISLRDFMKGLA